MVHDWLVFPWSPNVFISPLLCLFGIYFNTTYRCTCAVNDPLTERDQIFRNRLQAVSLFSWSVEQNARDTQMTTRVNEGARALRTKSEEKERLVAVYFRNWVNLDPELFIYLFICLFIYLFLKFYFSIVVILVFPPSSLFGLFFVIPDAIFCPNHSKELLVREDY